MLRNKKDHSVEMRRRFRGRGKGAARDGEGVKIIKVEYAHVSTSHNGCSSCVLHMCDNKNFF